jgi:Sec-independent protein secretion pathway component TatC
MENLIIEIAWTVVVVSLAAIAAAVALVILYAIGMTICQNFKRNTRKDRF